MWNDQISATASLVPLESVFAADNPQWLGGTEAI